MAELPVLSAEKIHLQRGRRSLFSDLHLEVARGEVVVIEAEAGAGATSLLKVCSGLIPPDRGTVRFAGTDLHLDPYARRRAAKMKLGFVFQESALLQNLSVFDNVALPLVYHELIPMDEVGDRVVKILRALDLDSMADQRPAELGLQEAHAASLARALSMGPEVIVFDDFFTRLSRTRASEIWDQVRTTVEGTLTAVIGTTDRDRVPAASAQVRVLREGRLVAG
ncbi:MAG: ATP-binding cassette domain-containing protein [Planctomycetota bacterium]|nr:ATP-binding cassette domain-containing protein [Planctomycetota bacterium]